ncbi:MAG: TPM domain-containing protein [Candidatus Saccharibacteria bacterium]
MGKRRVSSSRGLPGIVGPVIGLMFITIILMSLFASLAQAAVTVPSPPTSVYVLDQAGVLSDQAESAIVQTSRDLASKTKAQVSVVTLNTLGDRPIEEVSLAILREWGLGDKALNNGVLILVVPSERKSRIEVGYGLEGALPDGKTGRIQDQNMIPSFKQGRYEDGIIRGYSSVIQEVGKEYNVQVDFQQSRDYRTESQPVERSSPWSTILTIVLIIVLIWLDHRYLNGFLLGFLLGALFRGGFGGGGGRGGGDFGGGGSGGGGGSSRDW